MDSDNLCLAEKKLVFKPLTLNNIPLIKSYLQHHQYRTCDYTIGGLYMWADFFKYEYLIYNDTLFIKGASEIDPNVVSFSLPIGKLPLSEAFFMLKNYCGKHGFSFVLSAVPEDAMTELTKKYALRSESLEDWSDYLYDIDKLATLPGNLYNKKRNHVNKFSKSYPDYVYERIDEENLSEVVEYFRSFCSHYHDLSNPIAENELRMTGFVLDNYETFGFIGAVLRIEGKIEAFTIGEIINDTLYVHIEKASRNFSGIYETINMRFAADMAATYSEIKFVNREEDVGDLGLRKAKLSYHPALILKKYNLYE